MDKKYYAILCYSCFKDLGEPLDYSLHRTYKSDYYPCIANDRLGDSDDDEDYTFCSKCNNKTNYYYCRDLPKNVLYIDSLEEYEAITKETKFAIVHFVKNEGFRRILDYKKDSITNLLVGLTKVNGKEIAKKEGIDQECYLFYYNGKRIQSINDETETKDVYEIKDFIREFYQFCEINETIKSNLHEHELKKIPKRKECECSICKGLIQFNEDDIYSCFECKFTLCKYCKAEAEGKTDVKREYAAFEKIKDLNEYEEISKKVKKAVIFFYYPGSEYKELYNFIIKLKSEFPEIKFYKMEETKGVKIIKRGKQYLYPKMNEIYFLKNGLSIADNGRYYREFFKINDFVIELSGRDYEKVESKYHGHTLSKVKIISFTCEVCRKKFPRNNDLKFITAFKCVGCPSSYFTLCEDCRAKELEKSGEK